MWEPDTLRAGSVGPGRSEDGMSGKKKSGSLNINFIRTLPKFIRTCADEFGNPMP